MVLSDIERRAPLRAAVGRLAEQHDFTQTTDEEVVELPKERTDGGAASPR